ncbi:MAG TPA: adenylate/guanylate cyclase domain-containing protein, partial [Thermoplasmata archaeon]|nr:adenylate/guanylate cyclase domain-containing protein [Thermoplasmata archaeon]
MPGSRRLAAIMFTDMVGYSAMVQEDEEGSIAALERHNRALRPIFAKFHGREVKTIGDAFLVEFGSALEAVRCALEMQRQLQAASLTGGGGRPVQIRIGIHVGDVVEDNGDVLGDAVNIASRIEPLASPGGICLSQQVYDQVQNKVASTFV